MLSFMMEENVHLKNRLSEILSDVGTSKSLGEIEDFQSRFLRIDELIRILRNDVSELEQFISDQKEDAVSEHPQIHSKLSRIRLNIPMVERQLERMKAEFNNFLLAQS
jgi:hypothetical protein